MGKRFQPPAACDPEEVAALVEWLRLAVRSSEVSEWERKFCASIIAASQKRSTKGPWRPSAKQLAIMRRVVREQKDAAFGEEEVTDD